MRIGKFRVEVDKHVTGIHYFKYHTVTILNIGRLCLSLEK